MFYLSFFIGTCLSSHALVIYQRWPNLNFVFSRSYCDNCYYQLSLLDELPLISFLLLKGKCRYCQQPIPREAFFFELLGGFLFCRINLFTLSDLTAIILLFSLLLVAIADFYQKEFDLYFIVPAFLTAIFCNCYGQFNLSDWVSFLIVIFVLTINVWKQKIGAGDLLIYFILGSFFEPFYANLSFLIASLCLLSVYLIDINSNDEHYPFIPYILLGMIFAQTII